MSPEMQTPDGRFPEGVVNLVPEMALSESEISGVVDRIRVHAGIDYHPGQAVGLRNALMQRMLQLNISSVGEYLELIGSEAGREELAKLVSLVLVQKTSFFRDRPQFDLLEREVLPEVVARRKGSGIDINVWSAGCSTGEEPYSIAMVLRRNSFVRSQVNILATDISREALARAAEGRFVERSLADLGEMERALFVPENGHWRLSEGIRSLVQFRLHNLVSFPYPLPADGLWDVIFCRNVLIYFNRETVRGIIENFRKVLCPGGYLFLGVSESLFQLSEEFELVSTGKAFVYRKPERERRKPAAIVRKPEEKKRPPPAKRMLERLAPRPKVPVREQKSEVELDIEKARILLEEGAKDSAFRLLFDLTSRSPEAVEPYKMLGELALNRGALEEAWSWYQVVTELKPTDIDSRFLLAIVLYRLGHDQEASEHLRKLLFLDGNLALGHYYLGVVAHRLGDLDTALRSFKNALSAIEVGDSRREAEMLEKHNLSLSELAEASRARLRQLE